jgi:hypothetical protein
MLEASEVEGRLPLLQDKTITNFLTADDRKLAVYIRQGLLRPWNNAPDPRITARDAIERYVKIAPPQVPDRDKKTIPGTLRS